MNKQIQYKLYKIDIQKVQINSDSEHSIALEKLSFQLNPELIIDVRKKVIRIKLGIEIGEIEKKKEPLASFIFSFAFLVNQIKNFVKSEKNISLPGNFLLQLLNISVSTSRGIILEKTRNTVLEGDFLPLINTAELMANLKK